MCIDGSQLQQHQLRRNDVIATDARTMRVERLMTDTQITVTLYRSALRVTPQQSEALAAMPIAIATELCVRKNRGKISRQTKQPRRDKTSQQKTAVE